MTGLRADAWRARGEYFSWRPDDPTAAAVDIFHVQAGDPAAPVLVLVHGFPTSSIDWFDVADRLGERFRVCALDFPGYGFSDKPRGWGYNLVRDADLLQFYLAEVVGAGSAMVVAHDRGDSVALIHAARCANGTAPVGLDHLFLSNGNMYLPLSHLTLFQQLMLDETTAPGVLAAMTPQILAQGMGAETFTPRRGPGDPEVEALAATFAHADGIAVLHETIQYLIERSQDEQSWLATLAACAIPTTAVWGLNDTVSPPRVVSFVWQHYLMRKPGRNRLYFIPQANHYLQVDRPDAFVAAVLHALDSSDDAAPGAIEERPDAPLLVDASRDRIPTAAEVLAAPPPAG